MEKILLKIEQGDITSYEGGSGIANIEGKDYKFFAFKSQVDTENVDGESFVITIQL